MKAQIFSFKVHNSKKHLILLGNGTPNSCFVIQLQKTFTLEDAQRIIEKVKVGQF